MEQQLAAHPFFSGLEAKHLKLLAGFTVEATYPESQYLFREGDAALHLYAIVEGEVSLQINAPGEGCVAIQRVGAGEVVGSSWLVPPFRKRFDCRTVKPTRLLKVDAERLRAACETDIAFSHEMLKRTVLLLGKRLQATRLLLMDMHDIPR